MKSRVQIVLLVVGLLVLSHALMMWRYASLQETQTEKDLAADNERQMSSVRQLVQLTNSSLHENLHELINREYTGRQLGLSPATEDTLNQALVNSPFQAVALMRFDGNWQMSWVRQRPQLKGRWTDAFTQGVLQDLPVESAKNSVTTWVRVVDPAQSPLFLLISQLKEGNDSVVAVGFLPVTALRSVSEANLNSGSEVIVVDEKGVALAYPEQSYVGASLVEAYPAVAEVLKRREVTSQFSSQNRAKKSVLVSSAKVDNANLYVLTATPRDGAWAFLPRLLMTGFIFLLAFVALGASLSYHLMTPVEKALTYMGQQLMNIAQGQSVVYFDREKNPHLERIYDVVNKLVTRGPIEAPPQQLEGHKQNAYKELSTGLAEALKDPLTSVLAQAQLARSKSGAEDLKEHFVVIERETRKARDTIENLLRLGGEDRFPRSRIEIQDVISAALQAQKGLLSSHNVRVVKELAGGGPVMANLAQLQIALEEVLKNSIEAMEKKSERQLKIGSTVSDQLVAVTIEDNGSGIEQKLISRVFDPFFTNKESDQHKGLGLTVVKGIVKALGGNIRVESAGLDRGTRVVIELPVVGAKVTTGKFEVKAGPERSSSETLTLNVPLNGTGVDRLPTAPAPDEVTFTGVEIEASQFVTSPPPSDSENEIVNLRAPKVKESGS